MKILCVTDSLGLPRNNVPYESTWFYKLSQTYKTIHFIPKSIRSLNSSDIWIPDFSTFYNPDIVILQIGICDCAPRLYKRKRLFWVVLERIGGRYFYSLIKKIRKRSPKYSDISIDIFEKNIYNYINCLKKIPNFKKIVIILIGASKKKDQFANNPYFHDCITKYNEVLLSFNNNEDVIVIDPLSEPNNNIFVEDGYHINPLGHEIVYNQLKRIINEYV